MVKVPATGHLRPRTFSFALPNHGKGKAQVFGEVFANYIVHHDAHIASGISASDTRLGEIDWTEWDRERAIMTVGARVDYAMNHGTWCLIRIWADAPESIATGYGAMPEYGATHVGRHVFAESLDISRGGTAPRLDAPLGDWVETNQLLVPRETGTIITPGTQFSHILKTLEILPAELVEETAIRIEFLPESFD